MHTTLAQPSAPVSREPAPNRIRLTRAMCQTLVDSGLIDERFELIDGEVISKMGQNAPHMIAVVLLTAWLMRVFGFDRVFCQGTMDVAAPDLQTNAPEPDLMVVNRAVTTFTNIPGPADVLLLIEVSNTTLGFDLHNKAALYARAGIQDYWVADIVGRRFVVHRSPGETGYTNVTEYAEGATLAPLARPEAQIRVADLLPPAPAANP